MFELENMYVWTTLSDWRDAVRKKEVVIKKEYTCRKEVSDEVLYELIQCDMCGVFPFVNICSMKDGVINLIGDISFLDAILAFVSGERAMCWAGEEICYQSFDTIRKLQLAETKIHSIWIRTFSDEDISLLADIYKKYI